MYVGASVCTRVPSYQAQYAVQFFQPQPQSQQQQYTAVQQHYNSNRRTTAAVLEGFLLRL